MENKNATDKKEYFKWYNQQPKRKAYRQAYSKLDKVKQYNKVYRTEVYNKQPHIRIRNRIRTLVYLALKGKIKDKCIKNTENKLGYSIKELKEHLEKQFNGIMNGENYGEIGELDHIKQHSLFIYTSFEDEQFKKCWGLNNLRPIEKQENKLRNRGYKKKLQ